MSVRLLIVLSVVAGCSALEEERVATESEAVMARQLAAGIVGQQTELAEIDLASVFALYGTQIQRSPSAVACSASEQNYADCLGPQGWNFQGWRAGDTREIEGVLLESPDDHGFMHLSATREADVAGTLTARSTITRGGESYTLLIDSSAEDVRIVDGCPISGSLKVNGELGSISRAWTFEFSPGCDVMVVSTR